MCYELSPQLVPLLFVLSVRRSVVVYNIRPQESAGKGDSPLELLEVGFVRVEVVSTVRRRFSARCRVLVVVPTWRRLLVLFRVFVPLPTLFGVNYSSCTDFCHLWPDQEGSVSYFRWLH